MIDLVVTLAILAIVCILIFWLLRQVPLPEPIGRIVTIVMAVVVCLIVIGMLLSLTGTSIGPRLRL